MGPPQKLWCEAALESKRISGGSGMEGSIECRIMAKRAKAAAKAKRIEMEEFEASRAHLKPGYLKDEAIIHVGAAESRDQEGGSPCLEVTFTTEEEMFARMTGLTLCFIQWPERLEKMYQDGLTEMRMLGTAGIVIFLSAETLILLLVCEGVTINTEQWLTLMINMAIAVTCLCMPKNLHSMMK